MSELFLGFLVTTAGVAMVWALRGWCLIDGSNVIPVAKRFVGAWIVLVVAGIVAFAIWITLSFAGLINLVGGVLMGDDDGCFNC
jgi:hypothetical protein